MSGVETFCWVLGAGGSIASIVSITINVAQLFAARRRNKHFIASVRSNHNTFLKVFSLAEDGISARGGNREQSLHSIRELAEQATITNEQTLHTLPDTK